MISALDIVRAEQAQSGFFILTGRTVHCCVHFVHLGFFLDIMFSLAKEASKSIDFVIVECK